MDFEPVIVWNPCVYWQTVLESFYGCCQETELIIVSYHLPWTQNSQECSKVHINRSLNLLAVTLRNASSLVGQTERNDHHLSLVDCRQLFIYLVWYIVGTCFYSKTQLITFSQTRDVEAGPSSSFGGISTSDRATFWFSMGNSHFLLKSISFFTGFHWLVTYIFKKKKKYVMFHAMVIYRLTESSVCTYPQFLCVANMIYWFRCAVKTDRYLLSTRQFRLRTFILVS